MKKLKEHPQNDIRSCFNRKSRQPGPVTKSERLRIGIERDCKEFNLVLLAICD